MQKSDDFEQFLNNHTFADIQISFYEKGNYFVYSCCCTFTDTMP